MRDHIYFHERWAELWSNASAMLIFVLDLLLGGIIFRLACNRARNHSLLLPEKHKGKALVLKVAIIISLHLELKHLADWHLEP